MERNKRLQELTGSLSSELRGLTDTEESHEEWYCEVGRRVQTRTPTSLLLEQHFHHIYASPILPHCEDVVVGGGATSTSLPRRVVGGGATSTPLPRRVVGGGATSTPLPRCVFGGSATSTPLPRRVFGGSATSTPLPRCVFGGSATSTPLPRCVFGGSATSTPLLCPGRVSERSVQLIIDNIESPGRSSKKLKIKTKKSHKAVPSGRKAFREMLHKAKVVDSRFKKTRPSPKSPLHEGCRLLEPAEWANQNSFHYNPSHPNNQHTRDFLLPNVQQNIINK